MAAEANPLAVIRGTLVLSVTGAMVGRGDGVLGRGAVGGTTIDLGEANERNGWATLARTQAAQQHWVKYPSR